MPINDLIKKFAKDDDLSFLANEETLSALKEMFNKHPIQVKKISSKIKAVNVISFIFIACSVISLLFGAIGIGISTIIITVVYRFFSKQNAANEFLKMVSQEIEELSQKSEEYKKQLGENKLGKLIGKYLE